MRISFFNNFREDTEMNSFRKYFAEFLGTGTLVFIVAPLVGGALAALAYILLAGRKKSEE